MRPTEIFAARWKIALYLCASLIFVLGSLAGLQQPDDEAWKLQACVVFFTPASLVFAWLLIRPQHLLLDAQGFTLAGGLVRSPKKVYWREIDPFFVYRLPRGGKMIGYNYLPGVREDTMMRKFARAVGADGGLPKGWPKSPEKMVEDLNAYRQQAIDGAYASTAESTFPTPARSQFGQRRRATVE